MRKSRFTTNLAFYLVQNTILYIDCNLHEASHSDCAAATQMVTATAKNLKIIAMVRSV